MLSPLVVVATRRFIVLRDFVTFLIAILTMLLPFLVIVVSGRFTVIVIMMPPAGPNLPLIITNRKFWAIRSPRPAGLADRNAASSTLPELAAVIFVGPRGSDMAFAFVLLFLIGRYLIALLPAMIILFLPVIAMLFVALLFVVSAMALTVLLLVISSMTLMALLVVSAMALTVILLVITSMTLMALLLVISSMALTVLLLVISMTVAISLLPVTGAMTSRYLPLIVTNTDMRAVGGTGPADLADGDPTSRAFEEPVAVFPVSPGFADFAPAVGGRGDGGDEQGSEKAS
jgi:hypothetical protein